MNVTKKNTTVTVTKEQFQQILNLVCIAWRDKLSKIHHDFLWIEKKLISLSEIDEHLKNADKTLAAQIKTILKINDFKVGELVLCRIMNVSSTLDLRFYAGNGEVYNDQKKSGNDKHTPYQILKFDPNNLPPELRNESN